VPATIATAATPAPVPPASKGDFPVINKATFHRVAFLVLLDYNPDFRNFCVDFITGTAACFSFF
jgi:hypothetical protein